MTLKHPEHRLRPPPSAATLTVATTVVAVHIKPCTPLDDAFHDPILSWFDGVPARRPSIKHVRFALVAAIQGSSGLHVTVMDGLTAPNAPDVYGRHTRCGPWPGGPQRADRPVARGATPAPRERPHFGPAPRGPRSDLRVSSLLGEDATTCGWAGPGLVLASVQFHFRGGGSPRGRCREGWELTAACAGASG
jgi:hypothetical protein